MTTFILLVLILVTAIVAWLLRRRLVASILARLPRKETMTTALLFASIALLLAIALLPDILILISTMSLMPPFFRIVLGLVAAAVICVGCSKQYDKPKPHAIHWRAPDTGYSAETVPASPPDNKEGP